MCIFCEQDAQTVGKFFGYHQCCIDWFVDHAKTYGRGDTEHLTDYQKVFHNHTEGIGFMPCPDHAKRIIDDGLSSSDLVSNRICSTPFPNADTSSKHKKEFKNWIKNNLK